MDNMINHTPTAREVAELMQKGQFDKIEFADDALYETPFGLPNEPRVFTGKSTIMAHFARRRQDELAKGMTSLLIEKTDATIYETTDSGVVVFELHLKGKHRETGKPFTFTSTVSILTVRDGKITHWRDYPNFIVSAELTEHLPLLSQILLQARA